MCHEMLIKLYFDVPVYVVSFLHSIHKAWSHTQLLTLYFYTNLLTSINKFLVFFFTVYIFAQWINNQSA